MTESYDGNHELPIDSESAKAFYIFEDVANFIDANTPKPEDIPADPEPELLETLEENQYDLDQLEGDHGETFGSMGLAINSEGQSLFVGGDEVLLMREYPATLDIIYPYRFSYYLGESNVDGLYNRMYTFLAKTVMDNLDKQIEELEKFESNLDHPLMAGFDEDIATASIEKQRSIHFQNFKVVQPAYQAHELTNFASYKTMNERLSSGT